jgi:hypothetical protein
LHGLIVDLNRGDVWIGFLNHLFYDRSDIAGPGEMSIAFLLDKKPTVVPDDSAGEQWEAPEVFLMASTLKCSYCDTIELQHKT